MAHNDSLAEKHPKQDFQVDRLAFFSDAVFAIAITLLVIEFRVPHITKETTNTTLWQDLIGMKYKFFSVLMSYALISVYWVRHHFLFKYIHNYNGKVIRANLLSLLPIIFFPFTAAFFYEAASVNEEVLVIPFRLFLINNIMAGLTSYNLYYVVRKKHPHFSYDITQHEAAEFVRNTLLMAIGFALALGLSYIKLDLAVFGILPIVALRVISRFRKRNKIN